ncbi:O-antigen ligase family protein [Clostridium sp. YIM B02515]|uniref:O-antigen ligase family protein n=1 Tax=Clostridium rhizosphaerae TaxID=2803861 RepID=A0ABS1TB45_9CLOT|nr:O-antigen ligase family protein [Clostridium rhizosphaerae]MBL4936327.1 O-antigen ligase family protein [Clostridium rhizosphaerae]
MEKIFLVLPLIPYFKVLSEIINPIIFILASLVVVIKFRKRLVKVDLYLGAVLIIGLLSVFISKDKVISLLDSFYILICVPVFIISRKLSKEERAKTTLCIMYGGIITSILSIIRYFTNTDLRLDGLFNYANASALYFGICALIFFSEQHLFKESAKRYFANIGVVFVIAALFLTQSKGGILVYAAAVLFIAFTKKKDRQAFVNNLLLYNFLGLVISIIFYYRQYIIFILVLPIIIYLAVKQIKLKIKANVILYGILGIAIIGTAIVLSRTNLNSFKERLVFYEDGLRLLKNNLLGIGAGRLSYEQYTYQTAAYDIKYIHNGFLQIAIDYGIIFFVLYMALIIYILYKKFNKKQLSQLNFVIPMMILLHSLADFSMSFIIINMILWFYLAEDLERDGYQVKGTVPAKGRASSKVNLKVKETVSSNVGTATAKSYGDGLLLGDTPLHRKAGMAITVLLSSLSILAIAFIPGQFVYNIASINKGSSEKSYTILKSWTCFPMKTIRYYDKFSTLDFQIYSDKKDIKYLNEAIQNLTKCLNEHGDNSRIYELLGKTYFNLGDYDKAAESLKKSIEGRKYYLQNYDALIECYYNQFKSGSLSNEEYSSKLQAIENKIISLGKEINEKSKFMKNQPDGSLNDYEKSRISEAQSLSNETEEK